MPTRGARLALDGMFWRRAAWAGSRRLPAWLVRCLPPIIGAAIAVAAPRLRRRISSNLARARGGVSAVRDTVDVLRTFCNFASCLAEVLATGSKNGGPPETLLLAASGATRRMAGAGGAIVATAHTAGWETLGALLASDHRKRVMIVMARERDDGARELQDALRRLPPGVEIVHVGTDPLACLPLVRHLREGGVVAVQIDRVPAGMASRAVRLFDRPGAVPDGPLRLARLTGAPIVPTFSARTGHRRYTVHAHAPIEVPRDADDRALDDAAQRLADAFTGFVRQDPTQWFHFHD